MCACSVAAEPFDAYKPYEHTVEPTQRCDMPTVTATRGRHTSTINIAAQSCTSELDSVVYRRQYDMQSLMSDPKPVRSPTICKLISRLKVERKPSKCRIVSDELNTGTVSTYNSGESSTAYADILIILLNGHGDRYRSRGNVKNWNPEIVTIDCCTRHQTQVFCHVMDEIKNNSTDTAILYWHFICVYDNSMHNIIINSKLSV